ncbi:MAG: hypothetical protein IJR22_03050 [Acidaminococcaceae bacterium]|nr:hypothetical protein [Acidaminococcaceae bacterium]
MKYGKRSPFPASAENSKKQKAAKTALHLKVSVKKSEPLKECCDEKHQRTAADVLQ